MQKSGAKGDLKLEDEQGGEMDDLDQLCMTLSAAHKVVTPGTEMEMLATQDVIPATCVVKNLKLKLFMMLDPDFLLLVQRHSDPTKPGWSIVQMVVSMSNQFA